MNSYFEIDQAEGLRRMLERPQPCLFTFLSVLPERDKQTMLFNLSASLRTTGRQVLLFDASAESSYAPLLHERMASLLDVARLERTLDEVIQPLPQGFGLALLARPAQYGAVRAHAARLADAFDSLVKQADIVMLNAALDADDQLPFGAMESGEIVLQVSTNASSIKAAYVLLKRLSDQLGRRRFSLLISGGDEQEAHTVYRNLAQAAHRYLATPLDFLGAVPADAHIARAAVQGRTVVDAFPQASAALAFKRIAEQFLKPFGSEMSDALHL